MPRFSAICFRLARFASALALSASLHASPPSWAGGNGNASDNSKWSTGSTPGLSDTVAITTGSVTFSGNTTYGALLLSGGDLNGNASLTLGNVITSSWSGGSLSFSNGNGLAVSNGATLSVNGNGSVHDFAGSVISNNGTFDWSAGQLRTGSAGSITNSGTFKDSASDNISNALGGATGNFNNAGIYNKNAAGTTTLGLVFANTGNVNVNSGTLLLNAGGSNASGAKVNLGAGATLKFGGGSFAFNSANDITDAGGTLEFGGGSITFGGGSVAVQNVTVSGGTVNFTTSGGTTSNALTVSSGTLASGTYSTSGYNQTGGSVTGANVNLTGAGHSWTGGDMDGAGTLTLFGESSLSISGTSTHDFSQHTISNGGSINWSGGELRTGSSGGISNGGSFNDSASTNISNALGGAQGQFANSGTYNKTAAGTTNISLTFANTGSVHINSGTLQLTGGGSNAAGSTISVSEGAELRFGGGSFSVDSADDIGAAGSTVTVSGGSVSFGNGTLAANHLAVAGGTVSFTHGGGSANALAVTGGTLASGSFTVGSYTHSSGSVTGANVEVTGAGGTWSGGDMNGSGSLTIDSSASLDVTTSGTHDFSQHTITNNGNINWSTGELRTGSSGAVNNNGVFNDTASTNISNALGGTQGRFNNAGTYSKGGLGTTTISLDFENTGTVSVGNGTLELSGGGSNASGAKINVGAGNGLKISGGTFTIASAADIVDAGGTYTFAGGTTTFTSGNTTLGAVAVSGGTVGFTAGGANTNSLTLTNGTLASGNFTTAAYTHSGGSATGAAVHVTGGKASWSGGDMNGSGSLTLDSAVDLTIDTASVHDFSQHSINNNGNVTWSFGQLRTGSSGAITNNGTFVDTASDSISNALGGNQSIFTNGGTYNKNATGTTTMGLTLANHGTVNVNAGTLRVTGGGSSDGAFSTAANATTEFGADYTLSAGGALNGGGKYSHSAGTLNVANAVSVQNLAQSGGTLTPTSTVTVSNFDLTGGTVGGASGGELDVTGNITWTGGDMNASGKTKIGSGVALTIDDSVNNSRNFSGHEIVNNGTVNWNSAYLQTGQGGKFTNAAGATFNDFNASGYHVTNAYGGSSSFDNNGTYNRNAAGATYFDTAFNNGGTVNVQQGDLEIRGGGTMGATGAMTVAGNSNVYFRSGYTATDGSTLHGAGKYWLTGGTFSIDGTLDATTFNQTAGSLSGSNLVKGTYTWSGGDWNTAVGAGGTHPSTTIDSTATLNLTNSNSSGRNFDARQIVNNGTVNWSSGYIQSGDGGSFTNAAGATFNDSNASGFTVNAAYGSGFVFTNNGSYVRDAAGTTYFDTTFNNSGTVHIKSGDLQLRGGGTLNTGGTIQADAGTNVYFTTSYTVNDAASLTGAGSYWLTGGTLTANGTFNASSFRQTAGSLGGSNTLKGTYTWSGGDWNTSVGTGGTHDSTTIDSTATLNLSDTNSSGRNFDARQIVNNGTVNWSSGYIQSGHGGSFTNAAGATFNDANASSYTVNAAYGSGFVFTNNGNYIRDAAGTTYFDTTFNNNGSVHIKNGDLQLRGGGTLATGGSIQADTGTNVYFTTDYTVNDAAALTGTGTFWLTGGTLTANGTFNASSFHQIAGSLSGSNTLKGAYTWSGGDWNTSVGVGGTHPSTTIDSTATLNLTDTNSNGRNFDARQIVNNGTVNWSSGYLQSGHGGSFTNAAGATFNDLNAPGYTINATYGSGFTFTNNGTYNRNTTGTTYLDTTFDNNGTLNLQRGDMQLRQGGTMGANSVVNGTSGTHLYFTNNYTIADGAQFRGQGSFNQVAGTLTIDGTLAADSFLWSGGDWNTTAGSGATTTVGNGTILNLSDTNDHSRNFNARAIVNHGTVNWNSGFLQSGNGGSFTNAADGTFNDLNSPGYSINATFGNGFTFTNNGTYVRNTTGTTYLDTTFNNNGTVNLQQGDIQVRQGGNMGATSVVNGAKNTHLYFTNNYTISEGAQLRGEGLFNQIAGTLTIDGTLLADAFLWSGGDWNTAAGSGATTTIGNGTTLNIADTNDHARNFDARGIVNHGTVNWSSGYLQSGDGGSFTNAADGTFNDQNSPGYSVNAAFGNGFTFTNNGTYVRNTGGTTYFDTTFNNNGTLNLQQGDIQIRQGGTMGAASVVNVASGAHLYFTNNYTIGDGAQFRGAGLYDQVGGTLTINGNLLADAFVWSGGNWNTSAGSGDTTTIASGSTLELTDNNDHSRNFDARAIVNHGTVNWHSGYLESGHGGSFTNATDGTFNDINSPSYSVNAAFGSGFTFANDGTYVRNTGGTTYFDTTFNNNGTLNLEQGDIQIRQGGTMGASSVVNVSSGAHLYLTNDYTLADGAQFHGAGLIAQIGGTLTANGTLQADSFVWSGGNWNASIGSGEITTIGKGSTLTLTDGNDHSRNFDGRTIVNHGVVNWNSGYIQSGHNGGFTNANDGVFNDLNSPGYSMENPFGGSFSFTNNGAYNKSTSGTTTVDVPFANAGSLNITAGRMVFNGTFTNNGSLVLANGATAQFAAPLSFATTFLGGTGTIQAPSVTAGATVSPGNSPGTLAVTGDFTLLNTSLLLIELGGTTQGTQYDYLNIGGNVTLGGLLDLKFVNGFGGAVLGSDQFTIVSAGGTGGLSGAFANVASGGRLNTIDGVGSFQVNYNGLNAVTLTNFQPVPEPSTYVLLSGGLLAVFACLRRRRRS